MAGVKFITRKVKGSSLIETITAMLIISMVFGMALLIYLNVYKANGQILRAEAAIALQDAWAETERSKDFTNRSWKFDDFVLYREINPSTDNKDLLVIKFEIRNKEAKLLSERKFLKYVAQ